MEIIRFVSRIIVLPLLAAIFVYQKTISPDHGFVKVLYPYGFCKFHPSCSEYAKIILKRDGIIGIPKIITRIIKCRPNTTPAIDLP
jgi:putative component of membrane protein insertase Oxa1/YidC/SpoIIIJ protein YidD